MQLFMASFAVRNVPYGCAVSDLRYNDRLEYLANCEQASFPGRYCQARQSPQAKQDLGVYRFNMWPLA